MNDSKKILLVGGLKKARALAKALLKKDFEVTIINKIKNDCISLADMEEVSVIYGDGSRPFVLEDANAYEMGMVVALTKRDEDNLVICEICKKKYNVPKTVCLLSDPKKLDFFHKMGVDSVVCELSIITSILEQQVQVDAITNSMPIDDSNVSMLEITVPLEAPIAGKYLSEFDRPCDCIVGCIVRKGESILPSSDTQIHSGDRLIVMCYEKDRIEVAIALTGRKPKL